MTDGGPPHRPAERQRSGARRYRLTGIGAFETLLRTGRRRDGTYVQLISMPARMPLGRAGFIIGRKALPLAVDRNRLRRLLRVALERSRPAVSAYDVVLRLTRRCSRQELAAAAAEAERLLRSLPPREAPQ